MLGAARCESLPRGETIQSRQTGTNAIDGPGTRPPRDAGERVRSSSVVARIAAAASLVAAIVLVVLVLFTNGSTYTVRANFQDAGGLVTGDDVLIGPAKVGSVTSIDLTSNGQAQVVLGLDSDVGPLHQGTVARVYENSLSGIANKYVVLEPGPSEAAEIQDGGTIGEDHTYSIVNLDQLFDALNPMTRAGLRGFIRGEAASIQGRALQANRTLYYLAPGLASTSNVTAELARDEPAFDGLLVQGAQALQQLGSKSQELSELIANTNATTGAIAGQSQALQQTLALAPGALTHSTRTFAGLRSTLDVLDPLVAASKPASRRLTQFAVALRLASDASIPTLAQLNGLIHNPSGTGDLTSLLKQTPALAGVGAAAFPQLVKAMNQSQPQLDYLREYTPDVVAALTNLGQIGGYYDANGHYARTQPVFSAFAVNGANQLTPLPPFENRYTGLHVVHGRCPGGAVQPSPDGSAPEQVPGCQTSSTPPGP
jgi:phospholipid/cholesterol/gamma-HCH transport system substrate-binding protein